jgi:hypothetical protein
VDATDKLYEFRQEAAEAGIVVEPPSLNRSGATFGRGFIRAARSPRSANGRPARISTTSCAADIPTPLSMTMEMDATDKLYEFRQEAAEAGIVVEPPSLNRSGARSPRSANGRPARISTTSCAADIPTPLSAASP